MLVRKGYRFRLKPTRAQAASLATTASTVRFIWNSALALQNERFRKKAKLLSYAELCRELTAARNDPQLPWLRDVHSKPQQQVLRDLGRAFPRFFEKLKSGEVASKIARRRAKGKPIKRLPFYPRFKKKGVHEAFRHPERVKVDGRRVCIPGVGWIRFRKSRQIEGQLKNATIWFTDGHWYVSLQTEQELAKPIQPSRKQTGIDLGVNKFAALSNGKILEAANHFARLEKQMARQQRRLSRKEKFTNNWKKQKQRIARLHARIGNARRDFLHKASSAISKSHALVAMEALQVKNLSGSAKGSIEQPGKNVRQKAGLNKAILDQGWGEFHRQVNYKTTWRGGIFVDVAPQYTSQRCARCGHVSRDNRPAQSEFACVRCGHQADADVNAAKNILAAGRAVAACGDTRPVAA